MLTMVRNPLKKRSYQKARILRVRGKSINEIARMLQIAKSTVSLWINDIVLSSEQLEKLRDSRRKNFQYAALVHKNKRLNEIALIKEQAKKELKKLSPQELRLFGSALYWAEGSKSNGTSIS